MASNTNLCVFTGNITRDPEIKYIASGDGVCSFSIAVNRKRKNEETSMFLRVSCWGKLAEIVNQYAKKGSKVLVSGSLEVRKYTNNNGEEKEQWQITANSVELLGGNPNGQKKQESKPASDDIDEEPAF